MFGGWGPKRFLVALHIFYATNSVIFVLGVSYKRFTSSLASMLHVTWSPFLRIIHHQCFANSNYYV